jgi:4-hydroxy-tetrahydrodipicolinate synthase
MTVPYRGVIPPLVTPLTASGALDGSALAALVARQIEAGVDGVFLGGSTGEVALLPDGDRTAAVAVAVEAAAGRIPVLAGVIDTGTLRVAEHARRAADAGADAVVATPPFYVQPHEAEILDHFRLLAELSPVPVLAYSIPSATHVAVTPDAVETLAREGAIAGFKDSGGDLATFREAVRRVRAIEGLEGFGLFTGSELFADSALAAGGTGLVPGLGNVDPDGYVALQRLVDAGDLVGAAAEQDRLARLFRIVTVADRSRIGFTAGALGAFKAAMVLRGFLPTGRTAAPLGALVPEEVARIREIVAEAGLSLA